jgi:hypothetical protein
MVSVFDRVSTCIRCSDTYQNVSRGVMSSARSSSGSRSRPTRGALIEAGGRRRPSAKSDPDWVHLSEIHGGLGAPASAPHQTGTDFAFSRPRGFRFRWRGDLRAHARTRTRGPPAADGPTPRIIESRPRGRRVAGRRRPSAKSDPDWVRLSEIRGGLSAPATDRRVFGAGSRMVVGRQAPAPAFPAWLSKDSICFLPHVLEHAWPLESACP